MKANSRLVLTWLWSIALLSCGNKSIAQDDTINGHKYVDLGLSVVWATCNVGSSSPEDYGNYYAWGETSTKSRYTKENSKTAGISLDDIGGDSKYDAARANWGATWRLPTKTEMEELKDECEWTWTTINGHSGYKVTGPSGQSIFLPTAGFMGSNDPDNYVELYGSYWISTSSIHSILDDDDDTGDHLVFYNEANRAQFDFLEPVSIVEKPRLVGLSIRPVSAKPSKNGNKKSQSDTSTKKTSLLGQLADAIANKHRADSIKTQKAMQIRKATMNRRKAADKSPLHYTLSDLLTKPFGISSCIEPASLDGRMKELKSLSGLNFTLNYHTIYLVDVSSYPRLFDMSLTEAKEHYSDYDRQQQRFGGKLRLDEWSYKYSTSEKTLSASQADAFMKEIIASVNKAGGKVKAVVLEPHVRAMGSLWAAEGTCNGYRVQIQLYRRGHYRNGKFIYDSSGFALSIRILQ